ncbi:hypothetical protein UFOVP655_94 [uncultured Caudovirales phage]|uniref:Uncharacterized protein n=1 Tax=uncultured Caudovirales phage TaxID=2100421 RepID=A0A6J5NCQ2_9CAUD|nr:hypothetical protein UFOVP655_94 [uncultured Caudovirales phage]
MADAYVDKAQYTAYAALETELEVATNNSQPNAGDLDTAVSDALTAKNLAESIVASKFDILFLVGA